MRSPDTRLEETRAIKIYLISSHMRALGGDVTGRHACGNAAGGKGNNESHQESGLIFKVMDKNDPKVKAAIVHYRESSVQVRVLLTPQTTH
jgi:hypothetical protein